MVAHGEGFAPEQHTQVSEREDGKQPEEAEPKRATPGA
jgi:hypothetical protein